MELMKLWIGNVQGLDEMKASHKDLLSVQRVRRLKDGCCWWMSRIMLIPWQLLPPHRSW